jgi:hypothetical protein
VVADSVNAVDNNSTAAAPTKRKRVTPGRQVRGSQSHELFVNKEVPVVILSVYFFCFLGILYRPPTSRSVSCKCKLQGAASSRSSEWNGPLSPAFSKLPLAYSNPRIRPPFVSSEHQIERVPRQHGGLEHSIVREHGGLLTNHQRGPSVSSAAPIPSSRSRKIFLRRQKTRASGDGNWRRIWLVPPSQFFPSPR